MWLPNVEFCLLYRDPLPWLLRYDETTKDPEVETSWQRVENISSVTGKRAIFADGASRPNSKD